MGVAKGGLHRHHAPILTRTKAVDLQQYSQKETRSLEQDLSEHARGLLLHLCVKGSIVVWTSRELTSVRRCQKWLGGELCATSWAGEQGLASLQVPGACSGVMF